MDSSIRVLPDALVGRIAAGEVVERPASVIKELVENSLDAGAAHIEVSLDGEPQQFMQVADDGKGISAEELTLAVQRHATSKIQESDDLTQIHTLGFRGEGLAAIGAVARLRLSSRPLDSEMGASVFVEDGRIGAVEPIARAHGTTVEIRDLFFSTPARRRYLKSQTAEVRAISQLLQAYALGNPGVGFSLMQRSKQAFHFPAAPDLASRAAQILGAKRLDRMFPVEIEEADLALEGFLGAPEDSRARSGHQIFLVNGRWVTSPLLRQVVRQAYSDLIPPGRHPEALLSLRLPPEDVDVNVHPTKKEIRLRRERELYPRLTELLRRRVEGHFPSFQLSGQPEESLPDVLEEGRPESQTSLPLYPTSPKAEAEGWVSDQSSVVLPFPKTETKDSAEPTLANLWQLHETYICARVKQGLLIIDQHAAHERVLYEQALKRLQGDPPLSQELLFPLVVELTPDEFAVLLDSLSLLEKVGFHLETFGGTSVLVHAIPAGVREWKHGALLKDILDHISDLPSEMENHERVARSVACHGAVKAGQTLGNVEMNELVDQLFATEKPQGDPHGRPVFLRIELNELHRRFGRSS
ncbi:MAG: DNA mismatch repair endonuclease MutL [Candidatus Eisenbacteria bacterium]|uniref:DNA mismatch repair protein MutL n=1 Tax=Eiseniibacteriota bacterium TaxID=2212470 RepID=A0A7Y2EAU7_UNCEI|nr:DNA mismatch repair endonuclease MutL [Candidatus Eisenbacteria bacterium]